MTVLASSWAWIKKWWKWLLPVVGAGLWVLGRATAKRQIVIPSPELQGHAELEVEQNAFAEQKKAVIAAEKEKREHEIDVTYEDSIRESREVAEAKVIELSNEPIELNEYLKKVGRDVRSKQKN